MSHIFCFLFPEPIPATPSGCFGWKKEGWIFFCGSTIPTLTLIRKCFPVLIWRRKCVEHSFPFPATDTQSLCEGWSGDAHTDHTAARLVGWGCLPDTAHGEAEAGLTPAPLFSGMGTALLSPLLLSLPLFFPPPPPSLPPFPLLLHLHSLSLLLISCSSCCSSSSSASPLFFLSGSSADPDDLGCVAILLAWRDIFSQMLLPEENEHPQPAGIQMSTCVSYTQEGWPTAP